MGLNLSLLPWMCRRARTFVFFYAIILHLLVGLSMYRMSLASHYGYVIYYNCFYKHTSVSNVLNVTFRFTVWCLNANVLFLQSKMPL